MKWINTHFKDITKEDKHLKEVPNKLQCAYCVRNYTHGGECETRIRIDEVGCLAFKPDIRGCIRSSEGKIPFSLYAEIPLLNMWQDGWEYNGVSTEIRIISINGLSWDTRKGILYVHCWYEYYLNEFLKDYKEPKEKPKLKLIK